MAGQEGIGAAPLDGVAARPSGGSDGAAGSGFLALLALLQGGLGATPGDAAGSAVAIAGGAEVPTDDDAGEEAATEASAQGDAGVVVSLSAAAASGATQGATTPAGSAAGDGSGSGVAAATAATTGEAVATLLARPGGASQGTGGDAVASATEGATPAEPAATAPGTAPAQDVPAAAPRAAGTSAARSASGNGEVATPTSPGDAPSLATQARRHGTRAEQGEDAPSSTVAREAATTGTSPGARTGDTPGGARAAEHGGAQAPRYESAEAVVRLAASAAGRASRDDAAGSADDDADGERPSAEAASGSSGVTRGLPPGTRLLAEPLQTLSSVEAARLPGDANARPEALGVVRSDPTSTASGTEGTARLRAAGSADGAPGLPSWVERLASPDGLAATRRGNALHLDLEPNGLGRIEVRLSFGRDGVRASLITEHEHTRTLLASQQPQLAAALERNDLRLESFLVDVGAQSGGDGRQSARDAADPAAFDLIGLVHVSEQEVALEAPATSSLGSRGLVNVRA